MTLHKAKGLEFDIVFHLDAYRYVMPKYKEEEPGRDGYTQLLNLHYVGITRAKKACYIMQGTVRTNSSGDQSKAEPSSFLELNNLSQSRKRLLWK